MQKVTRDNLRSLFRKVKKLKLPDDLENKKFSELHYLGWIDEGDQAVYLVYPYQGKIEGLRLNFLRSTHKPLQRGFCEFCHKHRRRNEVLLISTKTKKLPKDARYRTRGTRICSDFDQCNIDMKDEKKLENFFYRILDAE